MIDLTGVLAPGEVKENSPGRKIGHPMKTYKPERIDGVEDKGSRNRPAR
jgi:hypothetical protein